MAIATWLRKNVGRWALRKHLDIASEAVDGVAITVLERLKKRYMARYDEETAMRFAAVIVNALMGRTPTTRDARSLAGRNRAVIRGELKRLAGADARTKAMISGALYCQALLQYFDRLSAVDYFGALERAEDLGILDTAASSVLDSPDELSDFHLAVGAFFSEEQM